MEPSDMKIPLAMLVILISFPSMAEDKNSQSFDMTAQVMDWRGQTIPDPFQVSKDDPDCKNCSPLTLGSAIAGAMCRDTQQSVAQPGIEKAKRCELGMRIEADKSAKLSAADISTIESNIGPLGPIISLRVIETIDPNGLTK
jgi:hypothetical protein